MLNRTIPIAIFFLSLAILLPPDPAKACGVLTHNEITQRGAWVFADDGFPEYQQRLSDHRGALLAGSTFPDWGWAFGFSGESTQAHSYSFVFEATDYIRETYPKPWNTETEKTAVFLLGMMSHVLSDTQFTTHRQKGYEEGFLGVLGQLDFHGNPDMAHRFGDFGGDILCSYQLDIDYLEPWYVPTTDMAQVYNNLGYSRVTPQILEVSTGLVYLATIAEKAAAWRLHDFWNQWSVFMKEQFQDYFIGGLDDLGIWSAWKWNEVIDRLEYGAKGVDAQEPEASETGPDWNIEYWAKIGRRMIEDGELVIEKEHTSRGVIFRASILSGPTRPDVEDAAKPEGLDRTLTYTMGTPYSYLGTSLAAGDFNGDGIDDLAIGSPGYSRPGLPQQGRVHVVCSDHPFQSDQSIDLSGDPADRTLDGLDIYGRFGWAVAAVDLNADGFDDLAVSAPTVGSAGLNYRGKVVVYFGQPEGKGLSELPDLTIEPEQDLAAFGWSLGAGDVDEDGFDDLLIGSPFAPSGGYQRGLVAIFLSSQNLTVDSVRSTSDAAWLHSGENDYDWFGYAIGVADFQEAGRRVLVGAPAFNDGRKQSVGRLYGYDAFSLPQTADFTVTGAGEFDKTGSAFAVMIPYDDGASYLALGSPTREIQGMPQAGAVHLLACWDLVGDLSLDELTPAAVFSGDQPYARLGSTIGASDANGDGQSDLWLTEPYRQTEAGFEAGAAHLLLAGENFPTGNAKGMADVADWSLDYWHRHSLFGNALAFADHDGDGTADVAIAARRATGQAQYSGQVMVTTAPLPKLATLSPDTAQPGRTLQFTATGLRLLDRNPVVELLGGQTTFSPTGFFLPDEDTLRFSLTLPPGTPPGAYDLRFENRFGETTLAGALEVLTTPQPDDDDDDDSDVSDDEDAGGDKQLSGDEHKDGCDC